MDFIELNRFAAALLGSVLLVVVLFVLGNLVIDPDEFEGIATAEVETATAEPASETEGEPASEPVEEVVATLAARLADGDASAGQRTSRRCTACHTFDEGGRNGIGPNLWGVLGAPRAANADYKYSGAFKEIGGDWGYAELDAFLESPRNAIEGNKMSFAGLRDAQDRANLILFLRNASDTELPLPRN